MKRTVTIPATFISIALGVLIALAGSQGSEIYNGVALFALCASVSYVLHWLIFIPSYIYQTEHYFDLTGSISYLSAIGLGFYLNPSMDPRDLLIGVLIVIWAVRLGTFLFSRVKQDGKDGRFTIMKTQFHWYIMTWTLGGLWVFLTMAAGLAAITSNVNIPLGTMAYLTRLMRSSMLEVVGSDYIRTAKSKGVPPPRIFTKHQVRNAILPVVTVLGPSIASITTGGFVVELVFAIPGLGRYFVQAVQQLDYTVIMGTTVFYGAFLVFMVILVDVLYGLIDPRVRVEQ